MNVCWLILETMYIRFPLQSIYPYIYTMGPAIVDGKEAKKKTKQRKEL